MSWSAAIDLYNIPHLYKEASIDKASISVRVLRQAQKWLDEGTRPRNSLYLYGNFGSGKTYLAHCLLRALIERGEINVMGGSYTQSDRPPFRLINSAMLDGELLDALENKQEAQSISKYADVPLLLIDDLGAERPTDRLARQYFLIIDRRVANGRTTIYTSNVEQAKIGEILGGRIASRLSQAELIKFPDVDFRSKK